MSAARLDRARLTSRVPRVRRPRLGLRGLLVTVVLLAVLAGAFLWYRDSSMVAVYSVSVTGVSGPDAAQIRADLGAAGRQMTTLDVDQARLRRAVRAYPVVRGLRVSTHYPHAMTIAVHEQIPVAVILAGGAHTAVDGSGTLLRQGDGGATLPTISLSVAPGGARLTGSGLADARLLAAAPYRLLARVQSAGTAPGRGLSITLRDGPAVYFGAPSQLGAKWSALVGVLADSTSAGAGYIDVSDPARPAAGTGADTSSAAAPASAGTSADAGVSGQVTTSSTG